MSYLGQAPGLGEAERFIFTATAVTDTVTADDNGVLVSYVPGQISIYLNGVKQVIPTDVTASNGSTLVFATDFAIGDVIEAIALSTFSPADAIPATGGTFTGNVTHSGTVTNSSTTTTTGDATHNGNIIMSANKKVKQKGAFMQSSTHQALTLGY